MSDMIEHVAQAIETAGSRLLSGENRKTHFERVARAAIDALREPSTKMIEAGAHQHELEFCIPGHPNPDLSGAAQCWRGMIDAALSDA